MFKTERLYSTVVDTVVFIETMDFKVHEFKSICKKQ